MNEYYHQKGILVGFGELFLKSENVQKIFKKKLIAHISFFLKKNKIEFKCFPKRERLFFQTKKTKKAVSILKKIFGISFLAVAFLFEGKNENDLLKQISYFLKKNYHSFIKKNETFAIRLKKEKKMSISRQELIKTLAKNIERKVDLEKPKKEIFLEFRKNYAFLYLKKIKGAGGLPFSSGGKALCLISGGIDSPVAGFLMLKRGVENVWLHFHSFPLVSNSSILKVRELGRVFLEYQPLLKIYFCPFSKIQVKIRNEIPEKYRIIFYRKIMLKIAKTIAQKEKCKALITGESLGQVSSQTIDNIQVIQEKFDFPIFRPLIEKDKEEIIKIAQKIKTFSISIKPQEDCCTLFTPKKATAKANLKIIKTLEKKLKIKKEIQEAIKNTKEEILS